MNAHRVRSEGRPIARGIGDRRNAGPDAPHPNTNPFVGADVSCTRSRQGARLQAARLWAPSRACSKHIPQRGAPGVTDRDGWANA